MTLSPLSRFIVFMAVVALAAPLNAAPLAPGGNLFPAPGEPDPGLSVLVDTMTVPFSAAPLYSGVLTSTVLSDPGNPLGGLTFVYELSNDLVSLDTIQRLTINSFAGVLVDASYQVPALGLAPSLITRSVAGTVGFRFQDAPLGPGYLSPGLTSALLVLETDSPTYVDTFASVIDGTVTNVASFAPAPIPEPSGIVLLVLGSVGLAGYAIRWQRKGL